MGIGRDFVDLMSDLKYTFHDFGLIEQALTHSSYSFEMKNKGIKYNSNESLEFLGDAVLELIISEELFSRYVGHNEGNLTKMRQALVCEKSLSDIAKHLSLGEYLNVGTGEENSDIRSGDKVLADALEALIAAIYLDDRTNSHSNYKKVILDLFEQNIKNVESSIKKDYKSKLQQFVEKNNDSILHYQCTSDGPDHEKEFVVRAMINNNEVGRGKGKTKRLAEMEAAKNALALFGLLD